METATAGSANGPVADELPTDYYGRPIDATCAYPCLRQLMDADADHRWPAFDQSGEGYFALCIDQGKRLMTPYQADYAAYGKSLSPNVQEAYFGAVRAAANPVRVELWQIHNRLSG